MRRRTRPSRRAVRVGSGVLGGAVTVGGREHMLVVMSRYFFLGVGGVVVRTLGGDCFVPPPATLRSRSRSSQFWVDGPRRHLMCQTGVSNHPAKETVRDGSYHNRPGY